MKQSTKPIFALRSQRISIERIVWFISIIIFSLLIIPSFRRFCADSGDRWLYIMLFSISLSAFLTPIMRLIALKLNILDMPGGRKIHEQTTPLGGGIAIVVAFNSALLVNMVLDLGTVILLCGGTLVALVGLVDDCVGVSARLKLFVQIFVVLVLIYFGIVLDLFPQTVWGYGLNVLFTILWIIGITNAMNFMDGMDGLAAGIGTITAMFMGMVAFQTGQPFMGWIAIAMMGSCIGFLPFNFGLKKSASIFLGDAGSTFIGFILAALAIKGDWADNSSRIVSFSAPVLIFWILIYDMAYITIERIMTGKVKSLKEWIDYVGTDHIHHRLYKLLGDKRKAVLFIYFLCATLGISAITLRYARPIDGVLLVVQAFLITVIVSIAEYSGRNR